MMGGTPPGDDPSVFSSEIRNMQGSESAPARATRPDCQVFGTMDASASPSCILDFNFVI
jgi:hypothetical protein